MFLALVALAVADKVYIPPLPFMPLEYALKVHYTITVDGKTANYVTARTYNLNGTSKHVFQYKEDDLVDGQLQASTIELPTTKHSAYRYNALTKECTSWAFTSAIDGFPILYRMPPYVMGFVRNETVAGLDGKTETNVFEYIFTHWWDQQTQKFITRTYRVWFKKDTNQAVQVYDSTADVDGHLYQVSGFTTKVDEEQDFVVPAAWNCKDPAVQSLII